MLKYLNQKNQKKKSTPDTNYIAISVEGTPNKKSSVDVASLKEASWEIDPTELEYDSKIGEGAYGIVWKGKFRGTPVAIKQLKDENWEESKVQEFRKETQLVRNLRNHINVVLLLGIVSIKKPYCIITEFYPKGSLLQVLNSKLDLSLNTIIDIIKGIGRGIYHLHSQNIVHRDIAARNILLTENFIPKITDFGLSRVLSGPSDSALTSSDVGPVKWMSPESISERIFSMKSDVWSFGILLIEIFTRQEPYPGKHVLEVASKLPQSKLLPSIPENAPDFIKTIMEQCFEFLPTERPDMKEICNELEKHD